MTMKLKILALLLKYRADFSTPEMSLNNYADYGIREEDFDALANDIDSLIDSAIEASEQETKLNEYYNEEYPEDYTEDYTEEKEGMD